MLLSNEQEWNVDTHNSDGSYVKKTNPKRLPTIPYISQNNEVTDLENRPWLLRAEGGNL